MPRVIETNLTEEDKKIEKTLRPQCLDDYIGQEKAKSTLKIYIEAAKQRHDSLDHVLFYGPPGLGKTTLAGIIANEMGVNMKVTSGPAIEKPGEMAAILNNLQEGDLLFVDEIHRLNRQVEEVLYPAMEDFAIDIMIGKGSTARSVRLDLPHFTLVGATTHPKKGGEWIYSRYFHLVEQRVWTFAVPRYSPESTSEYDYILLERASNREIKRFVKIKSEANPFAPEWQMYFEERETDKMRDTLNGRTKLLNIFLRQKGLCAACGRRMTVETGCKVHYLRCGNIRTKQMVHPVCHKKLHTQESVTFEPAPQRSGVSLEA